MSQYLASRNEKREEDEKGASLYNTDFNSTKPFQPVRHTAPAKHNRAVSVECSKITNKEGTQLLKEVKEMNWSIYKALSRKGI